MEIIIILFILINVEDGRFVIVGRGIFDNIGDGHPSFSPDGKWIITDTYPDRARLQHLLLYNIEDKKLVVLGSFFSPLKFSRPNRVDLHPRWSPDGKFISIDASFERIRRNYILEISKFLDKENEK